MIRDQSFYALDIPPARFFIALAGRPFLKAFFQMGIVLWAGEALFSGSVIRFLGFPFWISAAMGIGIYVGLGLFLGSWILIFKRGAFWSTLFSSANLLLAGIFYSVSTLPHALQWFAGWFPLTHLLRLARAGLLTSPPEFFSLRITMIYLITLLIFLLTGGILGLRYAFWRARCDGTLSHTSPL